MNLFECFDGQCQRSMLSTKKSQDVLNDLVFLGIGTLRNVGNKILRVFNRYPTFHKHLQTLVFDKYF